MKKSLIFALTALLAVSFTFFSCKPNEDEPKDDTTTEQPSGEDKGDTGNETGGGTDNGGSGSGGSTEKPSTDIVVDIAGSTITEDYGNTALISVDGSTLTITAGSYDSFTIALPSTIDISSATKMVINAKYDGDYTDPDAMVVGFVDSDDVQARADSWHTPGFMNPLTDTAKDYECAIADIQNLKYRDGEETTGFDNTKIAKIVIDPREAKGKIVISSIKFVK